MDRLFRYLPHADLVFHVLAHMRVQNPSDLFSPVYIQNMQPVRKLASFDLSAEIKRLEDGYNRDFQRLGIINFLFSAKISRSLSLSCCSGQASPRMISAASSVLSSIS